MKKRVNHIIISILAIFSLQLAASAGALHEYNRLNNNNGLSNSSVNTMFQDSDGIIWLGTWDGLNRYDGSSITQYRPNANIPTTISHQVVRSISEEGPDYLWVATDFGVNRLDKREEKFTRYYLDYSKDYIYEEGLFSCCVSPQGTVAAILKGGKLQRFDPYTEQFHPLEVGGSIDIVRVLFFDSNSMLWAETSGNKLLRLQINDGSNTSISLVVDLPEKAGKPLYDGNGKIWVQAAEKLYSMEINGLSPVLEPSGVSIKEPVNSVVSLPESTILGTTRNCYTISGDGSLSRMISEDVSVLSILLGSQKILWLGTDGLGVLYETVKPEFISSLRYNTPQPPIRAILKDHSGNLWIGSKGGGADKISPDGKVTNYNVGTGKTWNSVLCFAEGPTGVWIGTDGPGLRFYDFRTGLIRALNFSEFEAGKAICSVYSIVQCGDTLYLGTSGEGLFEIALDGDMTAVGVKCYRHSDTDTTSISSNIIYDIGDDGDVLWLATRGGGLNCFDKKTGRSVTFRTGPGVSNVICSDDVISLLKDTEDRLWVGTSSGLSMMSRDRQFRQFDENDGLPNTNIHMILQDSSGSIWVSTSRGLARINPENFSIRSWFYEDGLLGNEFSDGAGFTAKEDNCIYFGGVNGVNIIRPDLIGDDYFIPRLHLHTVSIDNEPSYVSGNTIKADYRTGSIALKFSLPDYINERKCSVSYCLTKGKSSRRESDWINIGASREIFLNRLSNWKYTLHVRASNSSNLWGEPLSYNIVISYPTMLQPWMVFCYFIVALILFCVFYHIRKSRMQMLEELENEKRDKAVKEEVHQAKLKFFTNIAHEFSNSITLIFGAVEQIFMTDIDDKSIKKQLVAIRSNADRMHWQIQELMEFRKADTGHLKTQYEKVDVGELIKYTLDNFIDAADSKKIRPAVKIQEGLPVWVLDRSMLEKIVFNLISNAMKYTPSEGEMSIQADVTGDGDLRVSVRNSGSGINPEDLSSVFDRFTVLDNFESKLSHGRYSRNGIGLALCKDLVNLMGGDIDVTSVVDEYTCFTFTLPPHDESEITTVPEKPALPDNPQPVIKALATNRQTILAVDDQEDILSLIKDVLSERYDVMTARSGEEAIETLKDNIPSLVICDIVMPGMGGIEFIRKVKEEERTRYIPVMMLSCNSDIENRVSVLESGADMFVGKPFHPRYLTAAVDRLLDNSEKLRRFSGSLADNVEKIAGGVSNKEDKHFVERVIETLDKNYGDETYNQDALARDLAISRVQLYRKIKQILSTTPGDLIRSYRLMQAENMLLQTDKTVQEIMYDCGFHNKAYFYREFTRVHQCSPKDFRRQQQEGA